MSSFGDLVTFIGPFAGIISILVAVTVVVVERSQRNARLNRIKEKAKNDKEWPRLGLQKDERGNIILRPPDESILSLTVQDYVSSSEVSQQVDKYLRPLRDLQRLRALLQSRDSRTQQVYQLRGSILNGVELQDLDLSSIDLSRSDLRNANLMETDLSDADLSNADLRNANLEKAILTHTNLKGADLTDLDLSSIDLSRADLRDTNLMETDLSDVDLSNADL